MARGSDETANAAQDLDSDATIVGRMAVLAGKTSSPLARLPYDLQAMAFVAALPQIRKVEDIKPLSTRRAPLNVSHVCRDWRRIALSTPMLWTHIHFNGNITLFRASTAERQKILSLATAVSILVERSSGCGLYVYVKTGHGWTDSEEKSIGMVVSRPLVTSRHRWEMASIWAEFSIWEHGCNSSDAWSLNNLEQIRELNFNLRPRKVSRGQAHNDRQFILDISDASRMTSLEFTVDIIPIQLGIDASSSLPALLSLCVYEERCTHGQVSLDTVFTLLTLSSSLQELKLYLPLGGFEELDGTTFCLEHLRVLELHAWDVDGIDVTHQAKAVIDRLLVPSLRSLIFELEGHHMNNNDIASSVLRLLQRSTPLLALLSIEIAAIPVDAVVACLKEVSSTLRNLQIWMYDFEHEDFARQLIVSSSADDATLVLCPQLDSLVLNSDYFIDDNSVIKSLLLSRSPPDDEDYPAMQDNFEYGMEVRVDSVAASKGLNGAAVLSELILYDGDNVDDIDIEEEVLDELRRDAIIAPLCNRGLKIVGFG